MYTKCKNCGHTMMIWRLHPKTYHCCYCELKARKKCKSCGHSRSWHGVPDENILGKLPCTHYGKDKSIDCQCDNFQE